MKELTKPTPLVQVTLQDIELFVASEVITLAKEAKAKGVSDHLALSVVQVVVAETYISLVVPGFLSR